MYSLQIGLMGINQFVFLSNIDREPKKVAYSPDNEMIYFIDGYPGKGGLYALPKDGGEPKPVVPNLIRPTAVAVDSKSG